MLYRELEKNVSRLSFFRPYNGLRFCRPKKINTQLRVLDLAPCVFSTTIRSLVCICPYNQYGRGKSLSVDSARPVGQGANPGNCTKGFGQRNRIRSEWWPESLAASTWNFLHILQHLVGLPSDLLNACLKDRHIINMSGARGILNTFGAYQTYYETGKLYTASSSNISWIGSVQSSLLLILGLLTGPLYDAGYFHALLYSGSLLIILGQMLTSLCYEYYQSLLAQGFCIGIGVSLILIPGVAILSTYFSSRLALANGIAAAGNGLSKHGISTK